MPLSNLTSQVMRRTRAALGHHGFIRTRRAGTLALCVGTAMMWTACMRVGGNPTEPFEPRETNVLFVGNSLIYTNDLPSVFQAVSLAGGSDFGVASLTYPNVALIDITFDRSAMQQIGSGTWDYVVMQQGTTSVPICRDTLVLAAQKMDTLIRRNGGTPALMMAWPSSARQHVWDDVYTSYALAAQRVNGVFLPVGDAWREAWKRDATLELYGGDGYHPGPAATLLAAFVLYEKFSGKDARDLPVEIRALPPGMRFSETIVRQLQEAAHAANIKPVPNIVVPPTIAGAPIRC